MKKVALAFMLFIVLIALSMVSSSTAVAQPKTVTFYTIVDTGFRSVAPGYYLTATCPVGMAVTGGGASIETKPGRALVTSRPNGSHQWIAAYEGPVSRLKVEAICVTLAIIS